MSNTIVTVASGRLSVEPRISQGNTSACFRLSFPRERKDGQSSWINAEVWVPLTRVPYLTDRVKKGAVVSVTGTLEAELYQGKDRWFIKSDDVTILQNPPGFVPRTADHPAGHHEDDGSQPYPEAPGYGPPGSLPTFGEPNGYGAPPHHGYAPGPEAGYTAPHPGYAAPAPAYTPPHQGYAPPAPHPHAAAPRPAPTPPASAAGTLKF